MVSHLPWGLVTGRVLGSSSWQGVGWPLGAGACSVCLFDTLEPSSASPCGLPRALPVPLAACSKVPYLYLDSGTTWLLPFRFRVPVSKSSSRNQLGMFYGCCFC